MGPAKDKQQAPEGRLKVYTRVVIMSEACNCAIIQETIALNRDWVYKQAYRMSKDIQVISIFFSVTINHRFELTT